MRVIKTPGAVLFKRATLLPPKGDAGIVTLSILKGVSAGFPSMGVAKIENSEMAVVQGAAVFVRQAPFVPLFEPLSTVQPVIAKDVL